MKRVDGLWWPDDTTDHQRDHSLRHVASIDWAIGACRKRRTAVQAGGNIGLWPRRLAQSFAHVVTFEPDLVSRECLTNNVPDNVLVKQSALGAELGRCRVKHRGLGSARVVDGDTHQIVPLDAFRLADVDLIALDVEGYELPALQGARATIDHSSPVIQIEMRGLGVKYGYSEDDVRSFLASLGYKEVSRQQGPDVVFAR